MSNFHEHLKKREQAKSEKIESRRIKIGEVIIGTIWPAGDNTERGIRILEEYKDRFDERTIEIEIEGETYYYNLTGSFYNKCPEIRGAYLERNYLPGRDKNRLLEWIKENGLRKGERIKIIVVEPLKKFRLGPKIA